MIAVDIFVPYMGEAYDFDLDENVPVGTLTEEIVELICQKAKIAPPKHGKCRLFDSQAGTMLSTSETLSEAGARPGQRFILC